MEETDNTVKRRICKVVKNEILIQQPNPYNYVKTQVHAEVYCVFDFIGNVITCLIILRPIRVYGVK